MLLTKTSRVIWKKTVTHDLEDTILDLSVSPDGLNIHTFSGKRIIISKDGKSVSLNDFPYRYLPKPRISIPFMIEHIENVCDAIKSKPKDMKKLLKTSKKYLKKDSFDEALFTVEMAMEMVNKLQLQVIMPKKVSGKFEITFRTHNYTLRELKVVYDMSEMKDFFKLSKVVVELPPIMRGMTVEEVVEAEPVYSGKIPFKINIVSTKTSFTYVQTIHVKKSTFSLSLGGLFKGKGKKEEKKRRLSDLLMGE